jgi:hypothetical protein
VYGLSNAGTRVWSVSSKRTGRPVFLWRIVARPNRVATWSNFIDANGNDIATAQLAVDGKIKKRELVFPAFDLQFGPDGPDVVWPQRRLSTNKLPFVPRHSN